MVRSSMTRTLTVKAKEANEQNRRSSVDLIVSRRMVRSLGSSPLVAAAPPPRPRRQYHHGGRGDHHHGGGAPPPADRWRPAHHRCGVGLTGDAASGDVPSSSAMEYAVKNFEQAGRHRRPSGQADHQRHEERPGPRATVANELLQEGAQIMVGPAFPGMAAGVIQAAAAKNVTVLGGHSTQPEYVNVGGVKAYLVAFGDNVQAAAMAEYATEDKATRPSTRWSPPTCPTPPSCRCSSRRSSRRRGQRDRHGHLQHWAAGLLPAGHQDRGSQP